MDKDKGKRMITDISKPTITLTGGTTFDYSSDPVKKPITIKNIKAWKRSLEEPKKTKESFKKLKLSNGNIIRYYKNSNKFETFDGQPIKVDDIFDELPVELQDKVMELLEQSRNNPK